MIVLPIPLKLAGLPNFMWGARGLGEVAYPGVGGGSTSERPGIRLKGCDLLEGSGIHCKVEDPTKMVNVSSTTALCLSLEFMWRIDRVANCRIAVI